MSRQKNNIVMKGARGMFGKQVVFKKRAGKSFVAAPPETDENRVPTAKQQETQDRFKESVEYAKEAIKDPVLGPVYLAAAKRGQSPYNVAFRDAFVAPEILEINTAGYKGIAGDAIVVQAEDDFKVTAVKVSIHDSEGNLIEEGAAVAGKKFNWTYTVTQANAVIAGTKITATAVDHPGNEGTLEVTL